jgi:UDP-N-acetylglucosamine--N-acetylmuramyl-(pentapeptide) pyrophosphoryl-undecaprenol N-acetylglucosamine transferase
MDRVFPEDKIIETGTPVRKDLLELKSKRAEARAFFGLHEQKKTILLFGGSLGARTLNQTMHANAGFIRQHDDIQVLWQMGKLYADTYAKCETAGLTNVRAMPFIDRMDLAYAIADVVICRAGALTISELSLAGKAVVLVPSPNVAEDHQTKNAMTLLERGAALMVQDKQASDALETARQVLENADSKLGLEISISALARPDAAERIAEIIIQSVNDET